MANNRKPINKRGKLSRGQRYQFAPESAFIRQTTGEGENRTTELIQNPRYPGTRRIIHYPNPNSYGSLWGYNGQQI